MRLTDRSRRDLLRSVAATATASVVSTEGVSGLSSKEELLVSLKDLPEEVSEAYSNIVGFGETPQLGGSVAPDMKGTVAATSVIKYDRWSASPEVYEGQAEKHDHPDIDIIHVLYTSQTERQAKRTLQEYIEPEKGTHEIPSQGREYAGVGEVDKKGSMVSHLSILYTTDSIGRAAAREALRSKEEYMSRIGGGKHE
jgi:hypothetical protein